MKISEIFTSIQGESTFAGMPCQFIRLSGCNLRCTYCDTTYSYGEGQEMSVDEVIGKVKVSGQKLVEITGGEPLLQPEDLAELTSRLLDSGCRVLIETNGTLSIRALDKRAVIIMDVKTPSSGMSELNDYTNFDVIGKFGEIKFVISNRADYEWAERIVREYGLPRRCTVLFSPAFGAMPPRDLAAWLLEDSLEVRLNIQLHKYIYDPDERQV
jgi:7-carboxy-7-deazaguanine synthase